MTDKKIIPQIDKKIAKKADEFAEREYETSGYERQWLSKGYYHGFMDANKGKLEEPVSKVWHDVSETPSIFGTYLLIHEGGWCVARYYGKEVPTGNTTGWVEISNNIFVEHPQKWLDLRDVLPKTK